MSDETERQKEKVKEAVRQSYGRFARRFVGEAAPARCCSPQQPAGRPTRCCGSGEPAGRPTSCCGSGEPAGGGRSEEQGEHGGVALELYSSQELAGLPESVTGAAAGCGNPSAIAKLRPGEVVLDLGSGGGIDCFLAAQKVGAEGRVIGLDMTPDMVRLAQRNAKKIGADNVEFRYGEMEDIPLPDSSVDVIISNCVINLSPDKDAVFAEAYRVLRPGGRISISDIVIDGDLPEAIRVRMDVWAGCIAGALDEGVYLGKMRAAGFSEVEVVSRDYVRIGSADGWEQYAEVLQQAGVSVQDLDRKIASVKITARRPAAAG